MPKQKGPQRSFLSFPGGAVRQGLAAAPYQADAFIERRQWARAREVLDALALDGQNPHALANLARFLIAGGDSLAAGLYPHAGAHAAPLHSPS